jgi:hypothetical protein
VHGYADLAGDFVLQAKPDKSNDLCVNAFPLRPGQIVQGTTVDMTSSGEEACGGASASNNSDVWYVVQGNGEWLEATTCTENAALNNQYWQETQISVFSGSCEDLECIGGNDYMMTEPCTYKSSVRFFGNKGTAYYVLVHGFNGHEVPFALQLKAT